MTLALRSLARRAAPLRALPVSRWAPGAGLGARLNSTMVSDPMTGELVSPLPDIQPHLLEVNKKPTPGKIPPSSSLVWGSSFTDHMLTIEWDAARGWGAPQIRPYGPLQIEPSAMVLHYAQELFEGLKAYRDANGKVTMFRPHMNMERMNNSARRVALPNFNGDALVEVIKEFVRVEKEWIPQQPGHSLYLRPTLIGTQPMLGPQPAKQALLFVIASPVGPYYPKGFKPVALYGTPDTEYIRAAPGGTGAFKLGANYAPAVVPAREAAKKGYVQNLWLHGPEHLLTEVGTMNMFVVFKRTDGATELVTPPLDGMILPGITRDSVLTIAREHASGTKRIPGLDENLVVSERSVSMKEVQETLKEGRLLELFGSGTAAVISTVDRIGFLGEDLAIPVGEDGMGPVSRPMWKEITGRQTGTIPSDWSVVVD